jgi:hypothetical protein
LYGTVTSSCAEIDGVVVELSGGNGSYNGSTVIDCGILTMSMFCSSELNAIQSQILIENVLESIISEGTPEQCDPFVLEIESSLLPGSCCDESDTVSWTITE